MTTILFDDLDRPMQMFTTAAFAAILTAMEPGRAMYAKTIGEVARWSDPSWILRSLASANLVERRGGYWRLTKWGEKARAGEAPPEDWPVAALPPNEGTG